MAVTREQLEGFIKNAAREVYGDEFVQMNDPVLAANSINKYQREVEFRAYGQKSQTETVIIKVKNEGGFDKDGNVAVEDAWDDDNTDWEFKRDVLLEIQQGITDGIIKTARVTDFDYEYGNAEIIGYTPLKKLFIVYRDTPTTVKFEQMSE